MLLRNKCYPLCLLLAALGAAVAGCSSPNDAAGEGRAADVPVAFAVASVSPVDTRAGELNTGNIASMGVFGYYTRGETWSVAAGYSFANFMNNERVAKSGSAWTYSPVKYWPNTAGDKITFFAYAPHSSDTYNPNTGEGVFSVIAATGSPTIYYRTPAKEEKQFDLLVATGLIDRTRSNAQLKFTMQHILTKVEFRVKSSSDITVGDLYLPDIHALAYIEFDKATGAPQITVSTRDPNDPDDPQVDAVACLNYGSINVPASEDPAVAGTTVATFYLPPLKPAKVHFGYNEGSWTVKDFDLPGEELWKPGKHVIYTIVIDKVKLTVTVSSVGNSGEWTTGGTLTPDCGNSTL